MRGPVGGISSLVRPFGMQGCICRMWLYCPAYIEQMHHIHMAGWVGGRADGRLNPDGAAAYQSRRCASCTVCHSRPLSKAGCYIIAITVPPPVMI